MSIDRLIPRERRKSLWFAARINVYTIALMALWNTMNTIVLPDRVRDTVSSSIRGTALGAIGFVGIAIAALLQPIAGRASDLAPRRDRRRPFIIGGSLLDAVALSLFWLAPSLWWLVLAYVLLQVASNVAQAAFQALIPDLVKEPERGLASGVKNGLDVLGGAVGLAGAAALLQLGAGRGGVLIYLALVIGLCAGLTWRWVPATAPRAGEGEEGDLRQALNPLHLMKSFAESFRGRATFRRAVVTRFLFFLGIYPVQRLFLFFLEDRFNITELGRATFAVLGAIMLGALAAAIAGELSDHLGRKPMLYASIALAVVGTVGIGFAPTLLVVGVAGALLAVGFGAFQAVNWALLSDDIPEGEGAKYFGLANLATAGGSAFASIFGPLVDLLNTYLPGGSYQLTFSLAALAALTSVIPLRRISDERDAGRRAQPRAGSAAGLFRRRPRVDLALPGRRREPS